MQMTKKSGMHAVWHVRMSSWSVFRTDWTPCLCREEIPVRRQKQRLCIARALLANAKILIFDDSTSAVDTATEKKIRKELEKLGDVTKIIIAQRISSVIHTDRIVILDDGKIHNIGTHEQLLKEDAIYQEIYASQMKGGNSDGIENEEC